MRRTEQLQGLRLMKFEEIYGRSYRGELSQLEAAEILGVSERTFRRWRDRFEAEGAAGLYDRRLGRVPWPLPRHHRRDRLLPNVLPMVQHRTSPWRDRDAHPGRRPSQSNPERAGAARADPASRLDPSSRTLRSRDPTTGSPSPSRLDQPTCDTHNRRNCSVNRNRHCLKVVDRFRRTMNNFGGASLYMRGYELVPTTAVRSHAQAKYSKRFPAAYGHHRSGAEAPRPMSSTKSPAPRENNLHHPGFLRTVISLASLNHSHHQTIFSFSTDSLSTTTYTGPRKERRQDMQSRYRQPDAEPKSFASPTLGIPVNNVMIDRHANNSLLSTPE